MKRLNNLSRNKKIALIIAGVSLAVLAIGGVIAYSHDRSVLNNKFTALGYRTVATETFSAPTNWLTCEKADKTITVKNESDVPVAVRIKISEGWEDTSGNSLPLISANSGLVMAQLNEEENLGWTRHGDYFYYDSDLAVGATTTTPISGVTLNCDANLDADSTPSDADYSNAQYTLRITAQTIQADAKSFVFPTLYSSIAEQANDSSYQIDFTRRAVVSDDISVSNGNGVNIYSENGETVYYYRGQINDNNVIWANECWLIVRTTFTGGIKMLYNGSPSDVIVNGVTTKQCNASGRNTGINASTYEYYVSYNSDLASAGYMHGRAHIPKQGYASADKIFVLSNDVRRDGDNYVLDTSEGQSVTGIWTDIKSNVSRMRYFCTDGNSQCDGTKIGYMTGDWWSSTNYWYVSINGYDDINGVLRAANSNTTNSYVKSAIDSWFVNKNLDGHIEGTRNYEDDLEDAIFCNDRTFVTGAMSGKDYVVQYGEDSKYGAHYRNAVLNENNNYSPSLDCDNKNDAFTVTETANTNGALTHKIALITMDELTLSGGAAGGSYLNNGSTAWTMSPGNMTNGPVSIYEWYGNASTGAPYDPYLVRPMVSLKAGTYYIYGDGTKTNPYIVE